MFVELPVLSGAATVPVAEVRDGQVVRIRLRGVGESGDDPPPTDEDRRVASALSERLGAWDSGHRVEVDVPLAWGGVSGFAERVLHALVEVQWGETITYGELAQRAGSPGAARAVGGVMAQNPWPLVLGCHRVLPAGGGVGNYQGGPALKAWLLAAEKSGDQPAPKRRSNS